jgi:hypothetical protein
MNSTFETIIKSVSEVDGMQATYGGGDYTITVWDDMEGGYDLVFTRSNTDIAHSREHADTADEAIARMKEFNADPEAWYSVEYGE